MSEPRLRVVVKDTARNARERELDALARRLAETHPRAFRDGRARDREPGALLSEPAIRELLRRVEEVAAWSIADAGAARRQLRKVPKLLARAERDLGDADQLLRRAVLANHLGSDTVQLPMLARAMSDEDWDALPEWLAAVSDLRERVLPALRRVAESAASEKATREPDPRDRGVAELARGFWDAERKRVGEGVGEPAARRLGATACHFVDKEGGRDGAPVTPRNPFTAFFADLVSSQLGWTATRAQTALGRWDRRER